MPGFTFTDSPVEQLTPTVAPRRTMYAEMPRSSAAPLAAVTRAAPLACALALGCGLVSPPLPPGAESFAPPPAYARWWALVEACSGARRPLGAVRFYRVPHAATVPSWGHGPAAAYYTRASDRIVIAGLYLQMGALVRHEMLHALLRVRGHPRAAFLGRCGGVVLCDAGCRADAGPAPAPDPAAVPVGPRDLEVTAALSPAAPSLAGDGGRFTFTVRVRNPRPYPVVVVAPAAPAAFVRASLRAGRRPFPTPSVRYQLQIAGAAGSLVTAAESRADDPTGYAYAPGETRQRVYDFALAPDAVGWATQLPGLGDAIALGPGRYALSGGYGNFWGERWSDSAVVTFVPATGGRADSGVGPRRPGAPAPAVRSR